MSRSKVFAELASQDVSKTEFNKLDGVTATTAELNVVTGGITTLGTVTAGTLGSGITFPTGHVIQVAKVYHTASSAIASGGALSELTTALRIAFTPAEATSTLFLEFYSPFCYPNSGQLHYGTFYDVTAGAAVSLPPAVGSRQRIHWINRTSPHDTNDMDQMNMSTVVASANTTERIYTIYHGTEGTSAQFLVSTLSNSAGGVYPMNFIITEVSA
jgi:hypothetical protein